MKNPEQMALVVGLAIHTSDRTADEQRALCAIAYQVDAERASTVGRDRIVTDTFGAVFRDPSNVPIRPSLLAAVEESYDPSEGRRVSAGKSLHAKYDRLVERFDGEVAPILAASERYWRARDELAVEAGLPSEGEAPGPDADPEADES